MKEYLIIFAVAMIISSIGFHKYVWFISIGYGFSITGIGIALMILFGGNLTPATVLLCIMLMLYGIRLGGFLLYRELKSAAYNAKMKKEISDGTGMSIFVKIAIWVTCALLYTLEASPVFFRLLNNKGSDAVAYVGLIIMILGMILESASDLQKSAAKKKNPGRFVDTGLFRIVRCPNYLGEILIWTGVFVSGITAYSGVLQWIMAAAGYICIVYIMFGGARRLEIRQNRTYGENPEYSREYSIYVKSVPILIPLVPLYSVEKYKWLVG